jgi:aryl-alcohol dehydrogenase-like predicted oxidoreductase
MGKALRDGYRDKVFLMTKVDAARRNLLRNNSINRFSGSRPATSTS